MSTATHRSSGYCATCWHDRHEGLLWEGALRCLHRAYRRRIGAVLRYPVASVSHKAVTAIGAIGATPAGAKVRKAWLDLVQCGYCQSGQIMSAAAILSSNPHPADARYRGGNVRQHLPLRYLYPHSRCDQAGGAIDETGRLTIIRGLDSPAKVNGAAVYGIDIRPPGVKFATLPVDPTVFEQQL